MQLVLVSFKKNFNRDISSVSISSWVEQKNDSVLPVVLPRVTWSKPMILEPLPLHRLFKEEFP